MKTECISTDRERKICGTCDHYCFESVDFGWMCASEDSDSSGDWVEYEDSCIFWESAEDDDGMDDYIIRNDRHIQSLIFEEDEE